MSVAALIVAAGRGSRLGAEVPKQYLDLGGKAVLCRTIEAFLDVGAVSSVLVVIGEGDRNFYQKAVTELSDPRLTQPVIGGATRAQSVRSGLEGLETGAPEKVLIHDAARPFVPRRVIEDVIDALDTVPGAFAALPVVDALWQAEADMAKAPTSRENLWRAQTPQGFRFHDILAAHRTGDESALDDVEVARAAGLDVRIVPGDEAAFKITTAQDLARARAMIS